MSTAVFAQKKDVLNFSMAFITFLTIFVWYTIGQRFTTSADGISEAIYNMNWYDADVSTRKDLLIILTMSQKSLVMETRLFGQISQVALAKDFKRIYVFYKWIVTLSTQM
ncbi:putative odorant receptor 85d [Onthophagus taurus]|uniref:putative odorant receptor 85d n=1 Tax=Onthophagus taurus TaxID=166361 RepID=UPI000C2044BC|nr:putative odorant receptor 85d [Onthophagus taurus]